MGRKSGRARARQPGRRRVSHAVTHLGSSAPRNLQDDILDIVAPPPARPAGSGPLVERQKPETGIHNLRPKEAK